MVVDGGGELHLEGVKCLAARSLFAVPSQHRYSQRLSHWSRIDGMPRSQGFCSTSFEFCFKVAEAVVGLTSATIMKLSRFMHDGQARRLSFVVPDQSDSEAKLNPE